MRVAVPSPQRIGVLSRTADRNRSLGQRAVVLAAALGLAALKADLAFAHIVAGPLGGFGSGFSHPLFGLDHLLAMLAVGIWGAQMGGRSIWTLPVTFPLVMAFGGVLGMAGVRIPDVELGIALSILVLGLAIAFAWRPFEPVAMLIVAVFAIFHGYAHGVELPRAADPVSYSVGFVLATGTIHLCGIGIGLVLGRLWNGKVSRGMGGAIAAGGLYFLWV